MADEKKTIVCAKCGKEYKEGSSHVCVSEETVKKLIEKFEKELGKK